MFSTDLAYSLINASDYFSHLDLHFDFEMHLRECPRKNQAGGDTTQISDFAQTWHKCWVWRVNDYGKNLG